ncbi:NAD-dependent epimerase/dehydratase family protein [Pendulispora albinea]|uniref:NAD-dependent epimerase/dehydratase family protein n=1 Tax=Pendulispora albinea TaxID=2741071 RepID=A0ABZ2LZT4_9BACT
MAHVLVTGGAGFIGSHVADHLLARGHRVRALDNLNPQVHGADRRRPKYLHPDVELVVGDVRDRRAVGTALDGIDAVVHLAALVGVGQSMYQIEEYTSVNTLGTAVLLEALSSKRVERLVVASSMSVYGEGLYRDPEGRITEAAARNRADLKEGRWEPRALDGAPLSALPTPELKSPNLESVYALSKYDQERLSLIVGRAYGIPTVALRFFNAYGPRQALSNPYTGVLAIFASRLLNGNRPLVFEDGLQQRDFVSVHDVARACLLAMESKSAPGQVYNVGSGRSVTVLEVARMIAKAVGRPELLPELTGRYRAGDIRHCFADISLAQRELGYQPTVTLERGIEELSQWLRGQVARDRVADARAELETRGLTL